MAPGLVDALNGDDDEERALRRALALSRRTNVAGQGSRSTRVAARPKDLIEIADDDDDDDDDDDEVEIVPSPRAPPPAKSSLLGLDRKQMEAERQARLKRKQAETETETENTASPPPSQRVRISPSALREASKPKAEPKPSPASSLRYPNGVVKRTWARGLPRQEDDIKLEEVLLKDELVFAVLSSFQWDEEWLLNKVNLRQTALLLVAFAAGEAQKAEIQAGAPSNRVRFCFPPMYGPIGHMHSKLMLLKYEAYLRIVVPTGNLVAYDWGETGGIENMLFIIDLPRLSVPAKKESQDMPFAVELARFLKAQGHTDDLVDSLNKYDFSRTAPYGFVHTIAGSHTNHKWNLTGYCGLGRVVTALGLGTESDIQVDVLASSIGLLKDSFVRAMYYACQGDSGVKEFDARGPARGKKDTAKPSATATAPKSLQPHFRIYFPSQKTVEESRGGVPGAGTLFLQSKWWSQTTFPSDLFREAKATRQRMLMHNKVMFVTGGSTCPWAYVGSANLSESAWGHLSKDRSSGQFKLTCRNWECGVLVPAKPPAAGNSVAEVTSLATLFRGHVPVPMEVPAKSFVANPEIGQPFLAGSPS